MAEPSDSPNVCASVADLVRLQYQARRLPLGKSSNVNSILVGPHRSNVRGRGLDFEELRQYQQGDDIRHMDWKVSKRTRKPHVRVYNEERDRPVMVMLDQRLSMFFGSRQLMKSVAAAHMAALIGWKSLANGDCIGSLIFNDESITEFSPHSSRKHLLNMLYSIEGHNKQLQAAETGRPTQLNHALKQLLNAAGHGRLIYIISDFDGANDLTGHYLSALAQRNSVILGFIFDPMEQHLPDGGKLAVSDGQYYIEVDTSDQNLREAFNHKFQQRLTRAREFLRAQHIPVLPISAAASVESQLLAMMSGGR